MPLTVKQKTKVVALWYETKSYVDTRWRFCQEYDLRTCDGPTNCAVQRIVKIFEHKGNSYNSRAVTINSEDYWAVIQKFHNDLTQKVTLNQLSMTRFMQDGAPLHTAGDTITFLWKLFRNHLIPPW